MNSLSFDKLRSGGLRTRQKEAELLSRDSLHTALPLVTKGYRDTMDVSYLLGTSAEASVSDTGEKDAILISKTTGAWMTVRRWVRHLPYFFLTCLSLVWEIVAGVLGIPIVTPEFSALEGQLAKTESYSEWRVVARMLDELDGYDEWCTEESSDYFSFQGIMGSIQELGALKRVGDTCALLDALASVVQRSPYGINNSQLYRYRTGTKNVIHSYTSLICFLVRSLVRDDPKATPQQRYNAVAQMRNNYGTTALLLNGGVLTAPIHLGVAKALHEVGLLPRVIYGSRAGAIVAALLACKENITAIDESLLNFSAFSRRSTQDVTQRRWHRFRTEGHLMDATVLLRFTRENLGDMTFMDAYRLTGRVLNIQYTSFYYNDDEETKGRSGRRASARDPSDRVQRCSCLLNYLTTPNVLVYSAAVSSMASVPFMFERVPLLARNLDGTVEEYDPAVLTRSYPLSRNDRNGGDRSTALHRLRELFHIRCFIVSECSTARVPLLNWRRWCFTGGEDPKLVRGARVFWREVSRLASSLASHTRLLDYHFTTAIENDVPSRMVEGAEGTGDTLVIYPISSLSELFELWGSPSPQQLRRSLLRCERQVWPRLEEVRMYRAIEQALAATLRDLRARYPDQIDPHAATAVF